jgi:hypothetical protein
METKGTSDLYYWDSDHVDINCCKGTNVQTDLISFLGVLDDYWSNLLIVREVV